MELLESIDQTRIKGVLERIIFSNEENHYYVGEFRVSGEKEAVTITGNLPGVQCGETLNLAGEWSNHPKHGKQFKIKEFRSELPSTVYGIRKYLGSGLIQGIGKIYALKIVDHFGEETLKIISEESERLKEVEGIGKQRAKSIKKAWDDQQAVRDVMLFLQTYGVGNAQCLKLVKAYGNKAKKILEQEPYRVAREIHGIGFKTADKIALNIGFSNLSNERIDAGTLFVIDEWEGQGHTVIAKETLRQQASTLLEAPFDLVEERINNLLEKEDLIQPEGTSLLQLPKTAYAEEKIAEIIHKLENQKSGLPKIEIEKAIEWSEKRSGFEFAEQQHNAVKMAIENKVSILTGGPGTGKTTILKAVVDVLRAKRARVLLASPTGRAAQRMAETTGASAKTIHRLLEFQPGLGTFFHNENEPLECDYLIVDETSMLDTKLAAALLRAVPPMAHILLVGDADQLPSVGPGNVLKNLIESKEIAVTRLNQIFRQGERSEIVMTAHDVLEGMAKPPESVQSRMDLERSGDLFFIPAYSPEECLERMKGLITKWIPEQFTLDPIMDLQVLAPLHKGTAGISNLNILLQQTLNPEGRSMLSGLTKYKTGDKVIQTKNNYDKGVFNGDLGQIRSVHPEDGKMVIDFDGELIEYERGDFSELQLAYAISIHKSQGSEFPVVVIPLIKQYFIMLQRNLLYTALTRGRKKVFIVGDPIAWAMAVKNQESTERETDLVRKLLYTQK